MEDKEAVVDTHLKTACNSMEHIHSEMDHMIDSHTLVTATHSLVLDKLVVVHKVQSRVIKARRSQNNRATTTNIHFNPCGDGFRLLSMSGRNTSLPSTASRSTVDTIFVKFGGFQHFLDLRNSFS